ncbi:hypothetical protein F5B22DRAFT_594165 [Xylaria bambusicola]|uniref:uncharacterized protein n=1 Tax=Xylaria bambusicola TaxID=326684 RepID=UPI0020079554|nr:uncharacterized protein F5B22DRAFT_594165 [Xylaria bambusicola]KAI0521810.1 hypothetical protein F5B22DRAFT_594165 [Xylaria bambusicola]
MAADSSPPSYASIDNGTHSHSYDITYQSPRLEQTAPSTTMSLHEQHENDSAHGKRHFFFHGWVTEITASLFSAACLVTISILLVIYHGRPVTSFPDGITLNTVVAVLTAAYKTALLYTVSSAIEQTKWNIFAARGRCLREFERIDEAGKSLHGALSALINIPWSIASLGAAIIILGFLIDPFAQQLINSVPSQVAIKSDSVWTEVFTNFDITPSIDEYLSEIVEYLDSALFSNASLYDRQAHCPTGNCTFPSVESLQWCAKTETIDVNRVTSNCTGEDRVDIFSEIKEYQLSTGNARTKHRRCDFFLDGDERPLTGLTQSFTVGTEAERYGTGFPHDPGSNKPISFMTSPTEFLRADYGWGVTGDSTCDTWLNISCPPAVLTYVRLNGSDLDVTRPEWAEQSVLTLCNAKLEVVVNSGHTTTKPTSLQHGRFLLNGPWGELTHTPAKLCFIPGENSKEGSLDAVRHTHEQKPQHSNSSLSFCWNKPNDYIEMSSPGPFWWDLLFFGLGVFAENRVVATKYEVSENGTSDFYYTYMDSYQDFIWAMWAKNLTGVMESLVAAMNSASNMYSNKRVTGSYLQYETIFQIRWEWIVLPILLNILAIVLQIVVVRQSRLLGQKQLWRGSVLAALYHGVDDRTVQSQMDTIADMRKDADNRVVRLQLSKNGRAMLMPQSTQSPA